MENRLEYWAGRWDAGDAPWHKPEVNSFLMEHFDRAFAPHREKANCRAFVPLCGKSLDMKWIYDQGLSVVGLDGVKEPILEFFKEQGMPFVEGKDDNIPYYSTEDGKLKIYHCDLFAISEEVCGKFDIIWDRGSLVAIYPQDRTKYAELMKKLFGPHCSYMVDTMVYDQSQYPGPPRSVPVAEIEILFRDACNIEVLQDIDRNEDPASPQSPKMRWNVDDCHEIILLLTSKLQ